MGSMINIPKVDKMTMDQLYSFWKKLGYEPTSLDYGDFREFQVRNKFNGTDAHGVAIKHEDKSWTDLAPEFHNAMMEWHCRRLVA
jgi:hypothetical protein